MADIELVIKIDKEIYKARQHWVANPKRMIDEVDIAIANGTPLPKGHGNLKDADKFNYNSDNYITKHGVESAPTIIEADVPKRRKGTPLEENDSGYDCEDWIP